MVTKQLGGVAAGDVTEVSPPTAAGEPKAATTEPRRRAVRQMVVFPGLEVQRTVHVSGRSGKLNLWDRSDIIVVVVASEE